MKRAIVAGLVLLATILAVGCGKKEGAASVAGGGASAKSPLSTNYENALPVVGQLMVGTFRLEGTGHALASAQAAELVPAWKGYRSLSASDSSSAAELEALVEQITDAMTDEQLEAIAAMKLTGEAMTAVMEEQGIESPAGRFGDMSEEQIASMRATRQASGGQAFPGGGAFASGPPGGGPGGFGGGPPGGQQPDPTRIAQMRARGGGGAFLARSPLYDKLIALLEAKT